MIGSLSADVLKMRKRWANWILVGILALWILGLTYTLSYFIFKNPPRGFRSDLPASVLLHIIYPENLVPTVLSDLGTIGAAIMLIMGALSTASEYGWSTVQTILVQRPGRSAVLAGKIGALVVATFVVTAVVFLVSAAASFLLANADGHPTQWASAADLARGFGVAWLIIGVYAALGMALGIVFRSTAAAIGGGLTYVFVLEAILGSLFGNVSYIKDVLKFLPRESVTALRDTFPFMPVALGRSGGGGPASISANRGLITLAVYLLGFIAISLLVFQRRDVGA